MNHIKQALNQQLKKSEERASQLKQNMARKQDWRDCGLEHKKTPNEDSTLGQARILGTESACRSLSDS